MTVSKLDIERVIAQLNNLKTETIKEIDALIDQVKELEGD